MRNLFSGFGVMEGSELMDRRKQIRDIMRKEQIQIYIGTERRILIINEVVEDGLKKVQ